MKKYDSYKDSGIEWIGEIPSHWEVNRIKFYLNYQKGKNPKELNFEKSSTSEIYLTMDFLRGDPKQILYVNDTDDYVQVDENEILLLWDGSNAGEFILSKRGILSSTTAVIYLDNIQKGYSWYYLKNFEPRLKESTIGMGIPHVNGEELKNGYIAIPSLTEQTAIANFLDLKTSEIDEIIADKKLLLELYEEEKTAIINKAVTKGINPDAPMKDSGIEWLGEIPEHWEVKRLKYVANLRSGQNIVSEQITTEGEFPVYGGNGLRGYYSEYTHDGEFVLIGRQGALCGNINYAKDKFWASDHAVVVAPTLNYITKYIGELLRVMNLNQYSISAAQPGLSVDRIKSLEIPFPNIQEQQSIVEHIESECSKIDFKKARTEELIELLTEYRTALISEVVTGKIKVTENCENNKGISQCHQNH
ncbi:MAG: restriction endonuclease subunit S [Fermentimonas sp.]|nr:restriction endonuclease subunit S [Fermentimonas sp.]MDD4009309.1 restriction endonuclease subunit S [Fermentimonas sp.]MDD4416731.1 restriction endonuclease subunit S [Proteiniphilum sp.]